MPLDPPDLRPAMDCAELARSAEALLDGEFDDRESAEAVAHLSSCEACRRKVEALGRARSAVREKLRAAIGPSSPLGRAPASLRLRVHEALERERRPWWRRALAPIPVSAAAACAAGALLVLYTQGEGAPLADEVALRHMRNLPLEVTTASAGADAIPGWFRGKVDFNPRPPEFRQGGATLMGGRISHIRDRTAAYMRYQLPRGQAGLFIVEDPERRLGDAAGREVSAGGSRIRMFNARGYNVAVWREDGVVYSLVSDLQEADLVRLVQAGLAAGR